jgi:hypothetical protein
MKNECCEKCWGNEDFGMCMVVRKDGNCLWEESIVNDNRKLVEEDMKDCKEEYKEKVRRMMDKGVEMWRCEYCWECDIKGCEVRVCDYEYIEGWEEMFEYGINVEYMKFMVFLKEYEDYWSYGSKYIECDNCGSVMVRMYFVDYDEVLESDVEFWGFLCGNCGNVEDF